MRLRQIQSHKYDSVDEEPAWWPKVVCWDLVNDQACQNNSSRNSFLYLFLDCFTLILEIHHSTWLLRSPPWMSGVSHINHEITRSSREGLLGLHLVVIYPTLWTRLTPLCCMILQRAHRGCEKMSVGCSTALAPSKVGKAYPWSTTSCRHANFTNKLQGKP